MNRLEPNRMPNQVSKAPVCDIIILTLERLDFLKSCIESVVKHTAVSVRIIVVNNGGGARIRGYLDSLKESERVKFSFRHFDTNQGFVRGNNLALGEGTAPYVCLLNYDCVVTTGWLEGMIEIAEKHPDIGVVNPRSSTMGEQTAVSATDPEECAKRYLPYRGQYAIMGSAVGFCMLIKRSLIEEIGLFDEEIDTAYFEDTDFSYRAREAGYKCVTAQGVFVYHAPFGKSKSISMKRREALMKKNRRWFYRKWGKPVRLVIFYNLVGGNMEAVKELLDYARRLGQNDNYVHFYVYVKKGQFKSRDEFLSQSGTDGRQIPNVRIVLNTINYHGLGELFRMVTKWRKPYSAALGVDVPEFRRTRWLKRLFGYKLLLVELPGHPLPEDLDKKSCYDAVYYQDTNVPGKTKQDRTGTCPSSLPIARLLTLRKDLAKGQVFA